MPENEQDILHAIESVIMLLEDEGIQDNLKDEEHYPEGLQKLRLPDKAREPLLHLLTRLDVLRLQEQGQLVQPKPDGKENYTGRKTQDALIEEMQVVQFEPFHQIRAAFWISMGMSVGLFGIGLVLMGVALYEATQQASLSISALTIGGLGLADFSLLFYRRPWQDVSVTLSNTQQVRTIVTTYLAGLALIQRGQPDKLTMLDQLTQSSLLNLELYTEERDRSKPDAVVTQPPAGEEGSGKKD